MKFYFLALFLSGVASQEKSPNIVVIMADDMGHWAMGAYGNPEIITPNMDRLADEGMLFTNAFVNTPVCSASRASYLTGRLPGQHGVHDWVDGGSGCPGSEAEPFLDHELFYTDVLKERGYDVGLSGKWHLGNTVQPIHGFDHWFAHQVGGGSFYDAPMVRNGTCYNAPGYITDVVTDDAIDFISQHGPGTGSAPFYIAVHYTAPHSPHYGPDGRADSMHPKEFVDLYENTTFYSVPQDPSQKAEGYVKVSYTEQCLGNRECLLGYFASITSMDYNIGRILQTLDQRGLTEETLVVFTSDHGMMTGHKGVWGKGNAGWPLNMFDLSLHVSLIFRHPGEIPPGVRIGETVQALDFPHTILDYAGSSFPNDGVRRLGRSYADLLTSKETLFQSHQFLLGEYGPNRFFRTDEWKLVQRSQGFTELFNLVQDPEETTNLAQEDVLKVLQMDQAMRQEFQQFTNPHLSGWQLPITGGGQLRNILYNSGGQRDKEPFNIGYAFVGGGGNQQQIKERTEL